ncbi:secondary thiamine-phosphate synthase enzyme YjbQ [Coxiella burnetii]|uniref:Hypothetical cytosolic protein n=2 Tax=Coxiella burnetii TaxID=777 RepID=Q83CE7_COXBU|nr:secondary thiamine-phosphate synthase enzyme YjbQ [Coxiella burnetii]NP_820168.2 hypothetical protein CBU_1171 [Coxiella burnetii RSA 493]AAO90682.2 hypothetical cytosolic protein [Coxiella burnetii RSA 493]ABS76939.2 hypothetical cytosolic protein [Coxiella burnetii Dugway 5J108-111]ACJ18230.1 hypothetical cytosolic protein [Coxiella burnetii CbuG_Q212]ACJ20240.1 hypothetical cytosolic protein [Coxiella burnetii CbuK_Q154]ARI65973.1 secondary thiamine-phosphate synthase [Coxiella burnetii
MKRAQWKKEMGMIYQKTLIFHTKARGTIDITDKVIDIVLSSECKKGLCHVFIQHTSASLIVCENADRTVRKDLERFMERFIQDGDKLFQHKVEGPDDMPAHLRTILTQTSLTVPIENNELALGTWQGIYLWEHRLGAHFRRRIMVTVMGS